MSGNRNKKRPAGKRKPPGIRIRPGRQLLYAGITIAALLGGYYIGQVVWPPREAKPVTASGEIAAHHLFPDPIENGRTKKAILPYEEALPHEIHRPDPASLPPSLTIRVIRPGDVAPEPIEEPGSRPGLAPPPLAAPEPPPPRRKAVAGEAPPPPPVPVAQVERVELLPVLALEDKPVWQRFAALPPEAAPEFGHKPMIAVVIDDMGIDRRRSEKIKALPGPLTLSYLTYANDLQAQADLARAAGHELLLHVPMEPSDPKVDPGPNVLKLGLSEDELLWRIRWALGRMEGFVGINNHMGSRFTANASGMRLVMRELAERGLLFLDSRTTGATAGPMAAIEAGVPLAERHVFLDNENDPAAVHERLADLEDVALSHGFAIGIGHPRDGTIQALGEWLQGLDERGFLLVPLTTIVYRIQTATG